MKLGSGLDKATTTMGPLANPRQVAAMHNMITDAVAIGARVATGGGNHNTIPSWRSPIISAKPFSSCARHLNMHRLMIDELMQ